MYLHNLTATVAAWGKQVDDVATVSEAERLLHEVDATGARCDTETSTGRVSALRGAVCLRLGIFVQATNRPSSPSDALPKPRDWLPDRTHAETPHKRRDSTRGSWRR